MSLEELVEAHLEGKEVAVPADLQAEFALAVAGHDALQFALGETITVPESEPVDGRPPVLPADYEVVRELGRGGMGIVYLVRQKSLGRLVAVKVLRPGEAAFGRLVQRFLGEARHLARLRHPNIVSIHEVGHAGDEPYFTMDYVEGEALSAILERERLSPTRALAILKQAAEGVRHAHAHGIIHRDLKPGNILVDPLGRAYVTDFGLARDMTTTSKLTHSGEVMGTPAYMAPEQAQGQSELIGETTDVHALGVILYEMLTGRPPYGHDSPANVLVRLLKEEPAAPRALDRRIPRDLQTICLKALAKSPDRRYPTVQAFLEDLRRFESGEPVQARRPGFLYHTGRFLRRHGKVAAAVLLPLVVLLAVSPRLFDKSVDQLIAVADEQRAAGDYQAAIRVYRRALTKANGDQRPAILGKMLACCDEIKDDKSAVDACLLVMESHPDVSFGKYDYLVAQAVVTQARSTDSNQSLRQVSDQNHPLLDLAQRRLKIFLDGKTGTSAQRKEAEQSFAVIQKVLAHEPFESAQSPDKPPLPAGTPQDLLRQAADQNINLGERGKAAYAAGLQLEATGQKVKALEAYKQGFELMRSVYPMYDGISWGAGAPLANECQILQKAFLAWQRLDPSIPNVLQGRLRLRLDNAVQFPPDLDVHLRIILYDPAVKRAEFDAQIYGPNVMVPLQRDGSVLLGVADGRYHISLSKGSWSWKSEEAHRIGVLFEVDPPALPVIEIRGGLTELSIPTRLLQEVKALEPADGAPLNLERDFMRWTPIEGAKSYHVHIGYHEDTVESSALYALPDVTVSSASLCLGALSTKDVPDQLRKQLRPGLTGVWWVEAFDAKGRKIGAMVQSNHAFLVARALDSR